jgi:hypothetical protein
VTFAANALARAPVRSSKKIGIGEGFDDRYPHDICIQEGGRADVTPDADSCTELAIKQTRQIRKPRGTKPMFPALRRYVAKLSVPILVAALATGGLSARPALAQGGGRVGGFGVGGFGVGNVGGYGGWGRGYGGLGYRGSYGGYGGFGPAYYGYGLGYGGYGLGSGLGYGGYGLGYGYGSYRYGYPYYGSSYTYPYGYGYSFPGYGYGAVTSTYPYSTAGVTTATTGFGYNSAYIAPAIGTVVSTPMEGRFLGIDEETAAGGMRVATVYAGTPADKAGLHVGDVIRSVNGFQTVQRGNLAWIIANAAPDKQLKLSIKSATDGEDHVLRATLP